MSPVFESGDAPEESTGFFVLALLADRQAPMSTFAIGAEIRNEARPMSVIVGILAAGGFIEAVSDRGVRTKLWALTPKGHQAIERRASAAKEALRWLKAQPRFSPAEAAILEELRSSNTQSLPISAFSTGRVDVRRALKSLEERLLVRNDGAALALSEAGKRDVDNFGLPNRTSEESKSVLRHTQQISSLGGSPSPRLRAREIIQTAWILIENWGVTESEKRQLLQLPCSPFAAEHVQTWKTSQAIRAAASAVRLTLSLHHSFQGDWTCAGSWLRQSDSHNSESRLELLKAGEWPAVDLQLSRRPNPSSYGPV
jgi:DNA-binding PadR family transcriptional regulator